MYKFIKIKVNVIIYFLFHLGPTLSTSTSSFEPLDPHDPNLSRLANTLFEKTSEYLLMELNSTQVSFIRVKNL